MERIVISDFIAGNFEQLTVSTTALGVTSSLLTKDAGNNKVTKVHKVFLSVESNPVRLRWDGTDPTSSVGHFMAAGTSIEIEGNKNIQQLRMIRQSASDGTVAITIYYDPVIQ